MNMVKRNDIPLQTILSAMILLLVGCTSVDTFLLTSETFPPKSSIQEVEIVDREPPCAHRALARLSMEGGASEDFRDEQFQILKKAAELGADAVVFSKPETHRERHLMPSRVMAGGPWGMGMYGYPGWGYGTGFGMGYGAGVAIPYDETVKSLEGIAIRYTDHTGPKC